MWLLRKLISAFGTGARAFIALVGVASITVAVADYSATQGSGTSFGSVVQTSVHYAKQIVCDFTAPATICATVKAANTVASTDVGLVVAVANTNANGQATMANSSPVAIASNQSAIPTSIDPCNDALTVKSFLPITATTSLVKVIATGTAAKKLYICQIILTTTAANNVAVFEATTGTTCATSAVAVYGAGTSVATAANGFPFPANGGVSLGNGLGTVGLTTVNNNDLCIGTSAATPLTGGITFATK